MSDQLYGIDNYYGDYYGGFYGEFYGSQDRTIRLQFGPRMSVEEYLKKGLRLPMKAVIGVETRRTPAADEEWFKSIDALRAERQRRRAEELERYLDEERRMRERQARS